MPTPRAPRPLCPAAWDQASAPVWDGSDNPTGRTNITARRALAQWKRGVLDLGDAAEVVTAARACAADQGSPHRSPLMQWMAYWAMRLDVAGALPALAGGPFGSPLSHPLVLVLPALVALTVRPDQTASAPSATRSITQQAKALSRWAEDELKGEVLDPLPIVIAALLRDSTTPDRAAQALADAITGIACAARRSAPQEMAAWGIMEQSGFDCATQSAAVQMLFALSVGGPRVTDLLDDAVWAPLHAVWNATVPYVHHVLLRERNQDVTQIHGAAGALIDRIRLTNDLKISSHRPLSRPRSM